MLKGCLYRKFFGDDKMFGKKKKEDVQPVPQQVPQQMQPIQQPPFQYQQQPPVQQTQSMQPMIHQQMEEPTKFSIAERGMTQIPMTIVSGSGQVIQTGEMQEKEVIRIIYNLSMDDLVEILAGTPKNSSINVKIKELMKRLVK
jgi:hypothetical protein